jgi:hypothetical protein
MSFGMMAGMYDAPGMMIFGLMMISIWTVIWKGFALWHSSKNQQKGWFIAVLVLNTMGLLPIIYLIWFKPKCNNCEVKEEKVVEKNPSKRVVKKKAVKKTTKKKR